MAELTLNTTDIVAAIEKGLAGFLTVTGDASARLIRTTGGVER